MKLCDEKQHKVTGYTKHTCHLYTSVGVWFNTMNSYMNAHPVVALNKWRLLWSGGKPIYHGFHRVRHLGDVTAFFLPAGEFHGQHVFGLEIPEKETKKERKRVDHG